MDSWLSAEDVAERYPGIVLPAYLAVPDFEHTRGPTVGAVAALAGIPPDPQQQLGLGIIFAVKPFDLFQDEWLALVAEFCIIVGRQVMKSTLFEMVLLGWLFVTNEDDVTYSAHEDRSAASIYSRLSRRIKNTPQLAEYLPVTDNQGCYSANGQRRIELADGRKVEFVTRTEDGSRGLGKAKVILDEAFAPTSLQLAAILALILAQADPQVLYASMAGKADSEALRGIRDEGRARANNDGAYVEWGAPPAREICDDGDDCTHLWGRAVGCGFDKPKYRKIAMPSYLARLTKRAVDVLRKRLTPHDFGRECFSWWDEPTRKGDPPAINLERWGALEDEYDERSKTYVPAPTDMSWMGLDSDLDVAWVSIGAAAERADGRIHLEHVHRAPGDEWVVERMKELDEKHGPVTVAIDGGGPCAHLIEPLGNAGIRVEVLTTAQVAEGWLRIRKGINTPGSIKYVHGPDDVLSDAAEVVRQRSMGEKGWAPGRRKSDGDSSPFTSVAWAAWLCEEMDYDIADSAF